VQPLRVLQQVGEAGPARGLAGDDPLAQVVPGPPMRLAPGAEMLAALGEDRKRVGPGHLVDVDGRVRDPVVGQGVALSEGPCGPGEQPPCAARAAADPRPGYGSMFWFSRKRLSGS
jgi:hypothetical protein